MEEVLVVVPQNDQVRFVVSNLAADARRWFMTTYSACGHPRPSDWSSLRKELQAVFSPEFEKASHRSRLLKIRQVGALEDYITEFRSLCISSPGVDDLTQAILFTEGLKPSVRRVVKQAHAETLQAAMRAARAAECEPEAAGEETPPSATSTFLRQGDVDHVHGGNTFSCGSTDSGRAHRTDVIPAVITVDGVAT